MAAVWFKYPNPHAEHVRSIDTLDQRVCPDTGEVHMERLIAVQQTAPAWIRKVRGIFDQKLLGVTDTTYVRELIRFDPRTPAVDMESANDYLIVNERIRYSPGEANATRFDQTARFHCRGLDSSDNSWLASAAHKVEEASVKRFRQNAEKGREGFRYVLMALFGDPSVVEYESQTLDRP